MELSGAQDIIQGLNGREVQDRRRFRQLMRKEIPKTGMEYMTKDKKYYLKGWCISYDDDAQKIIVASSDEAVVAKIPNVAADKNVGGTRKPRKKKAKKDGYPHTPDAVELRDSLKAYLDDPENGIAWHERLDRDNPTEIYFATDLWAMSRVTRDPAIFINLLEAKLERLKVVFVDPDDVEWLFRPPALFWVGPVQRRQP